MIKAIFFDVDGTIRHNEPRGGDVFAGQAERLGLRVREDDLLRAARWEHYYWARSGELKADQEEFARLSNGGVIRQANAQSTAGPEQPLDDGAESSKLGDDFWLRYSHRQLVALGASDAQARALARPLHEFMKRSYNPVTVVPAELADVLRGLNETGWVLGVITNRSKPLGGLLEELGLASHFRYVLTGGEINAWKPQPAIFHHACKQVGVEPSEAVYVGDNYFADVVGAKAAGVTPVLYDPLGIFDDPECAIIRSFTELPRALGIALAPQPSDRNRIPLRGA
jgi:HAD superfamily hydrolase (TIGR01549 family)